MYSVVKYLVRRHKRTGGADSKFEGTDQHGCDTHDDSQTDGAEAGTCYGLSAQCGNTIHGGRKKFHLHSINDRGSNRLIHHNRLLSQ